MLGSFAQVSVTRRWLLVVLLITSSRINAGAKDERVALVIGNSHYSYASSLQNTINDAQDVGKALTSIGFDVTLKRDITKEEFLGVLDALDVHAKEGKEVVFYYSGHAFQKDGKNYLAPVDIHVSALEGIDREAVSLDAVIHALAGSQGPKVILLDSCRTPFPGLLQGLARPLATLPDLLISFSTAPDHTADDGDGPHSPFTRALLKMMVEPGLTVEESLREVRRIVETSTEERQIPWDESSLKTSVYFRPPVYVTAQIQAADDDVMVIVNGDDLTSWGNDGNSQRKIPVHAGRNPFVIRVFNQRSYTGGVQGLGGHLPEGWRYAVLLGIGDGPALGTFSDSEDRPEDNGPRHGKWFTVVRGVIEVDENTSQIRLIDVDARAWLR
jgi:hypothetical protein